MAQIIDFEKSKVKKITNKVIKPDQLELEILITVIKFLYAYMEKELDNPIDDIHPGASLHELFDGSRERFAHSFVSLIKYWSLDPIDWNEVPLNKEFETFKTVEDLCVYLEEKITNSQH